MLIYSMSASLDGFIADRAGGFAWSVPSEEQFRFHIEEVRALGGALLGRRLYETMLPWETDPSLRDGEDASDFADAWAAIPKVVFSRTLDRVEGNARLAQGSVADEIGTALAATGKDVEIGGADLASTAIARGLVDEFRILRNPIVVGGGSPFFPPVDTHIDLELMETRTFADRVVFERYRRARSGSRG
jgi:dihydrofolate reductase